MPVKRYLGLSKTMFNSNVAELLVHEDEGMELQIVLSERLSRKKWDGSWPLQALSHLCADRKDYDLILENRDLSKPSFKEELYQKNSPFYEMIEARGLGKCLSKNNSQLEFVEHHLAHAYSALYQTPFQECYILVMDGGGSRDERGFIEHTSLYFWNGRELEVKEKEYLEYKSYSQQPYKLAEGIGSFYERAAQLIFNDGLSSGKVMGLSAFGKSFYDSRKSLVENACQLDWKRSFQGKSKQEWQESENLSYWQDVAATVQEAFELTLMRWIDSIADSGNPIVFTGGCALNCVANYKVVQKVGKDNFFVPANPGDEGISLGLVYKAYLDGNKREKRDIPSREAMTSAQSCTYPVTLDLFDEFFVTPLKGSFSPVVACLENEKVVAWYQGSSECGQRALGHRSLLANCENDGLKDYLNKTIKFREDFRPYGASVLWEEAHRFFECPEGFHNTFMSYAIPIKKEMRKDLKEVCHRDGTCRMQTVHREGNPRYHQLLSQWYKSGHHPILLNTSLNVMGEPIVETPKDLYDFFVNSPINSMVYEDFLIQKVKSV